MSEREGLVNCYTCRACGARHVTRNVDAGVTPFLIQCRRCGDMASSCFYRVDQSTAPGFEWYRPDAAEREALTPELREWVDGGRLLLREIPARAPDDPMAWG